jgi:hypothetical protein
MQKYVMIDVSIAQYFFYSLSHSLLLSPAKERMSATTTAATTKEKN